MASTNSDRTTQADPVHAPAHAAVAAIPKETDEVAASDKTFESKFPGHTAFMRTETPISAAEAGMLVAEMKELYRDKENLDDLDRIHPTMIQEIHEIWRKEQDLVADVPRDDLCNFIHFCGFWYWPKAGDGGLDLVQKKQRAVRWGVESARGLRECRERDAREARAGLDLCMAATRLGSLYLREVKNEYITAQGRVTDALLYLPQDDPAHLQAHMDEVEENAGGLDQIIGIMDDLLKKVEDTLAGNSE